MNSHDAQAKGFHAGGVLCRWVMNDGKIVNLSIHWQTRTNLTRPNLVQGVPDSAQGITLGAVQPFPNVTWSSVKILIFYLFIYLFS
jgi:hypothetical protein